MAFLPSNYEPPVTGKYLKLTIGKHRVRVLGPAIVGNEFWTIGTDEKTGAEIRVPVRRPMGVAIHDHELGFDRDGKKEKVKHFWAFPVWNHVGKCVQILEITQQTIQNAIRALIDDQDYGDPTRYDLKIERKGDGLDTEYTVLPGPPTPIDPSIIQGFNAAKINLNALFVGGDPFEATVPINDEQAGTDTVTLPTCVVEAKNDPRRGPLRVCRTMVGATTYATVDPGITADMLRLQGKRVKLSWEATSAGRRVVSITEVVAPAPSILPPDPAMGHQPVEEDDIPF